MPRIVSVSAEPFKTPLHHPFVTSQGRANSARGIAITLKTESGIETRGESAPVQYVTGETLESVTEAVGGIGAALVGLDVTRYRAAFDVISAIAPNSPSARCGVEMAVLEALAQTTGSSLWHLWGGAKESVETDMTIPIVPNAAELAELAWGLGIRVFKIKVGEADIEADHARVLAIRNAAPEAHIRLDANQAFTPDNALHFVERLLTEGAHIELLEQPVPKEDLAGMEFVAARSPIPVFADESCRTPQEAMRLINETQVQGFNCKINKSGIAGVLDIIALARAAGRRLMLGCMLETRRSIAVSLALACGTGAFEFLDLDSHLLLNESGENRFFHQHGPVMLLSTPTV